MIANFFWLLTFAGLWIAGIWTLFQPGMLLQSVGDWLQYYSKLAFGKKAGEMVLKPVFLCPPCQSSLHGSAIWFLSGGSWEMWIPFVVCLCGALSIIFRVLPSDA